MKQPVKVVMLPTEDITRLYKDEHTHLHHIKYNDHSLFDALDNGSSQHLYITVSQDVEPIKKGDWCLDVIGVPLGASPKVRVATKDFAKDSIGTNDAYKIIATTDPKLLKRANWISTDVQGYWECANCEEWTELTEDRTCKCKPVAKLLQSFLKEFVANPNGKWEVEYETNNINNQEIIFHEEHKENFFEDRIDGIWKPYIPLKVKLKLNSNNTVNISFVEPKVYTEEEMSMHYDKAFVEGLVKGKASVEEKMYSTEEVESKLYEICEWFNKDVMASGFLSKTRIDNWIKENIK